MDDGTQEDGQQDSGQDLGGPDEGGQGRGGQGPGEGAAYQVLARKYRPQNFAEMIGQDALVRTLTNAIQSDRLAHAWLLTGVRGVGKTTAARIIALALNCIGPDGAGGPTAEPCGQCDNCRAIADGRHPDVLEMDAASRTGVDDVRELIEGVRYRPSSARYKVYIIDEVHMLSTNAFNALLKTLEEPPEHVKFIFATTEVRKVPVTVLSRCQRFDLRRVSEELLTKHFATIAEAEGAQVEPGALRLIARAADGSVRDGLSILDQALAGDGARGAITEDAVRAMLGLADRSQVFHLFEHVMRGDIAAALDRLSAQHDAGADAERVMGDLLDLTHWLTRVKITPAVADDPVVPEAERVLGRELAEGLSMAALARAWQMLLKGLNEVQHAPQPMQAAEMVLVRLAYGASLPSPADLIQRLESEAAAVPAPAAAAAAPAAKPALGAPGAGAQAVAPPPAEAPADPAALPGHMTDAPPPPSAPVAQAAPASQPRPRPQPGPEPEADPVSTEAPAAALPESFEAVIELLDGAREGRLAAELRTQAHLVHFAPGRIEFRPGERAESSLASRLGAALQRLTGARWAITLSSAAGAATLAQQEQSLEDARKREAAAHPLVKAALEAFPGAEIAEVRDAAMAPEEAPLIDPESESSEDEA
ncbi:MAG: DNA polymerase III subunit gamma/tau [Alphaproteobacteria bacterium]|nr:DNA polymerase III subunit gamma/tau [Alphaproteobacteria bacterium]